MITVADLRAEFERGDLPGSVLFHAAVGEEAAEPGTKTLLERGYDGDYGVVLEPTAMRTATSVKGCAYYEIEVAGETAHAGQPEDGRNALVRAIPVLEQLREYGQAVSEREDSLVGPEHATLTMLEAGVKENVVPGRAVVSMDRRFDPERTAAEIDQEIDEQLATVEAATGVEASWRRTRTYDSASAPADGTLAEIFRRHSSSVADVPSEEYGLTIATDMRNFVNDARMEAITWGPGAISQAHSVDEHVDLEEVATGARILKRSVSALLQSG